MFARKSRGLLDFIGAALVVWAAAYHTPVGALLRSLGARVAGTQSSARPLLSYYSGGVYEVAPQQAPANPQIPDTDALATIPPGTALGRGVYATVLRLGPDARTRADGLARRYSLAQVSTPDDAALLVARAKGELGTDDASVLAVFTGYEVASYAVARSRAEGREPTLDVLVRQLPPSSAPSVDATSSALMLGAAWSLAWPVPLTTRVASPFGYRIHPMKKTQQLHTGVDLSVPEGTDVHVTADGTVRRASEDDVNGRVVIVDHGHGVATAYCHNSKLLVTTGQRVHAGEVISLSGNTGMSTGPHLHYQLALAGRPTDPFIFHSNKPVTALPELAVPKPTPTLVVQPVPAPSAALKNAFDKVAHEAEPAPGTASRGAEDTEVAP